MSTTALAASSVMISASAARDAKEAKCAALIDGYEHATATIEQRQSYADCIDLMHPGQLTGAEIFIVKAMIVCAIIGAAIGGFQGYDFSEKCLYALFGLVFGALAPVIFVAINWAIHFLFTA